MTVDDFPNVLSKHFRPIDSNDSNDLPFLAHYTTLETFENILKNQCFLMSNPSFMNDAQELYFGLNEGRKQLKRVEDDKDLLEKIGGKDNFKIILDNFDIFYGKFFSKNPPRIFILCFSEYDENNYPDGSLPMWREYGANGQGVALIMHPLFLTNFLVRSPFYFTKIKYGSNVERTENLKNIYNEFFGIIANQIVDINILERAGKYIFYAALFFALKFKHNAFEDEKEWRIFYASPIDEVHIDEFHQYAKERLSYLIKNNTIYPKLELGINFDSERIPPSTENPFDVNLVLHRLLLGPSHSSQLALEATKQMLINLGKKHLIEKLMSSTIPYRPHSGI